MKIKSLSLCVAAIAPFAVLGCKEQPVVKADVQDKRPPMGTMARKAVDRYRSRDAAAPGGTVQHPDAPATPAGG